MLQFLQNQEKLYSDQQNQVEQRQLIVSVFNGDGKGLDACNIFAKVVDSDKQKLMDLGNSIWKNGSQELTLSLLDTEV